MERPWSISASYRSRVSAGRLRSRPIRSIMRRWCGQKVSRAAPSVAATKPGEWTPTGRSPARSSPRRSAVARRYRSTNGGHRDVVAVVLAHPGVVDADLDGRRRMFPG